MRRSPLSHARATPNGAWRQQRTHPRFCKRTTSPCTHWGLDLGGRQGELVRAPEAGTVVVSRAVSLDQRDPPWTGFGPGVVLLRGDSGAWHLLAHLRGLAFDLDPDVDAREAGEDVTDALEQAGGYRVDLGEVVGELAGLHRRSGGGWNGHVHWEVRPRPLAGHAATLDPLAWLRGGLPTLFPKRAEEPAPRRSVWPWVLLAALAFSQR